MSLKAISSLFETKRSCNHIFVVTSGHLVSIAQTWSSHKVQFLPLGEKNKNKNERPVTILQVSALVFSFDLKPRADCQLHISISGAFPDTSLCVIMKIKLRKTHQKYPHLCFNNAWKDGRESLNGVFTKIIMQALGKSGAIFSLCLLII